MMSILSRRRDSNTRPLRPERSALPTAPLLELLPYISKAGAKVLLFFELCKFFEIILHFFYGKRLFRV